MSRSLPQQRGSALAVLAYIDYCELWGSRYRSVPYGDPCDLPNRALRLVGLRATRRNGAVVGMRQVRPGVWSEEEAA